MIFQTRRLVVRKALPCPKDVDHFYALWTTPEVMKFVGFPKGLKITKEEILASIGKQKKSQYDQALVVERMDGGEMIGECKLGLPDKDGHSVTDVKLFPSWWNKGYGTEIKRALVNHLFTTTDCRGVKATPNRENRASQKMQVAVGAKRVGDEVFRFPEHMRSYTVDVHAFVYIVFREDWEIMNHAGL